MDTKEKGQIIYKVVKFCHKRLLKHQNVLDYLITKRGLTEESINKFEIGLFPQDLRELFQIIEAKFLRDAGIIKHASKSVFQIRDLVIPVKDVYGNTVALAGRCRLSEEERNKKKIKVSKYINSKYNKSHHLFGLHFAKHSILEKNVAYVVEGYFDVITPHQNGLTNVVAICGAHLSTRQLVILSRYTNKIILLFDNEEEAQERAFRDAEKKRREGIILTVSNPLKSSSAKDIDQFLRENSVEEFISLLEPENIYNNIKPFWD
jgi:DNA primase